MSEIPEIPAPMIPPEGVKDKPLDFTPDAATRAAIARTEAQLLKAMTPADEGAAVERLRECLALAERWVSDTGWHYLHMPARSDVVAVLAALEEAETERQHEMRLIRELTERAEKAEALNARLREAGQRIVAEKPSMKPCGLTSRIAISEQMKFAIWDLAALLAEADGE